MAKKQRFKKPEGQAEQWKTPKKRVKGESVFYPDEPKSETLKITLTKRAKNRFKELALLNKLSISEYFERFAREDKELILPRSNRKD